VGVPEGKLVLGKHSGRHALKNRCEDLGFHLTKEELDVVYTEITRLADNKKGLMDEEIAELARRSQQVGQALPPVEVTA
jgi:2-isopropylmalate synthase